MLVHDKGSGLVGVVLSEDGCSLSFGFTPSLRASNAFYFDALSALHKSLLVSEMNIFIECQRMNEYIHWYTEIH